jgi:hypothetical protein
MNFRLQNAFLFFPIIIIFHLLLKAYSTLDISVHHFKVHFTMKLTYRTIPYDDDNDVLETDAEMTESGGNPASDIHNRAQWDDDCPWSEWYSAEDPVKGTLCLGFFIHSCFLFKALVLVSV